jgi:GNAT superfamily N-acetyltransferase
MTPEAVPRLASARDEDAIRDLVRAAYAPYVPRIGREPGPMTDDYAARIAAGEAWVVEQAGTLLAVLVLEDFPDSLQLDNIAIAPSAQGKGLGRALVAFTEAEARRRGHAKVTLYTNEKMVENLALYPRLGFVETHRSSQAGFARVFMAKALGPAR